MIIDAAPDEVWMLLGDIANHVQWMADADSIEFVGEQRTGVGTAFTCITKLGPIRLRDEMEITAWDDGELMGVAHRGAVTGTGTFRLEPVKAGSTRVMWEEKLVFPWWLGWRLGATIGRPVLAAVWRRNLQALRRTVERRI